MKKQGPNEKKKAASKRLFEWKQSSDDQIGDDIDNVDSSNENEDSVACEDSSSKNNSLYIYT